MVAVHESTRGAQTQEYFYRARSSIWAESDEDWDGTHPSWKAVGLPPIRIAKSAYEESGLPREAVLELCDSAFWQLLSAPMSCREHFYALSYASGRTATAQSQMAISPGEYVIVEADRGEDLAMVTGEASQEMEHPVDSDSKGSLECVNGQMAVQDGVPCLQKGFARVLRLASSQDIATLETRRNQEAQALEICIALARERGYPMSITRSELQWDERKITFYFRSARRIDFKELVCDLFRLFKIRIWMSMENKN